MNRKFLNKSDLCSRYNCSVSTINRWEKSGIIPKAIRPISGGPRRWDGAEIEERDRELLAARTP